MNARFDIVANPDRDLVTITIAGFFDVTTVEALDRQRAAAYGKLRCPPNAHVTLCDVTAMQIQSQEVVAAFAKVTSNPRFTSRRLAFVTSASLARLQTQRVTKREGVAHFNSVADAEAWLFSSEMADRQDAA